MKFSVTDHRQLDLVLVEDVGMCAKDLGLRRLADSCKTLGPASRYKNRLATITRVLPDVGSRMVRE
jgi:hypothetical protein